MKPINLKTLLKKSQNARNAEHYEKLAQKESDMEWLKKLANGELRPYMKDIKPLSVGMRNFFKSIVVAVKCLKP